MSYFARGYSIASIGNVTLNTGSNTMFGKIWNCWKKRENASNVLVTRTYSKWNSAKCAFITTTEYKAIHTSEDVVKSLPKYPAGKKLDLMADQTGRNLGEWTVVGVYAHDEAGLKAIAGQTGKTSVLFATFK
jgi:hypothetical protein